MFLVEAGDADGAATIAAAVRDDSLGVAVEGICCVLISQATYHGVKPWEQPGALQRFATPLRAAFTGAK